MSINDQLESDVNNFFEQVENQSRIDKRETLRNLLKKYAHLNSSECVLDHHDLKQIISQAMGIFSNQAFPVFIGDGLHDKVDSTNLANLSVIEATIGHFNKLDCFKRLPKFDYRKK